MGTEKQNATACEEPQILSPTAAERQLMAPLKAMVQDFAEPNVFRTETVCRGSLKPFSRSEKTMEKRRR